MRSRLEVTQEGYRLSTLRSDNLKLEEDNRNLRLGVAEVASRERLRALAPKCQSRSARAGQVVTLPERAVQKAPRPYWRVDHRAGRALRADRAQARRAGGVRPGRA